jgi:hypothetical protein
VNYATDVNIVGKEKVESSEDSMMYCLKKIMKNFSPCSFSGNISKKTQIT